MNSESWEIDKIINVANELQCTGRSAASTGEIIAAAFVLNRPDLLPYGYKDIITAWDRLGEDWQCFVRVIKRDCLHLIEGR